MYLGKVIGSVVSTNKDESMKGHKLLMVRPMLVANRIQILSAANAIGLALADARQACGNAFHRLNQGCEPNQTIYTDRAPTCVQNRCTIRTQ